MKLISNLQTLGESQQNTNRFANRAKSRILNISGFITDQRNHYCTTKYEIEYAISAFSEIGFIYHSMLLKISANIPNSTGRNVAFFSRIL